MTLQDILSTELSSVEHLQAEELQGMGGMLFTAVGEDPFFCLGQALQKPLHLPGGEEEEGYTSFQPMADCTTHKHPQRYIIQRK